MIHLLNLLSHFVVSYWLAGLLAVKGVYSLALVMKVKRNLPKAIFFLYPLSTAFSGAFLPSRNRSFCGVLKVRGWNSGP